MEGADDVEGGAASDVVDAAEDDIGAEEDSMPGSAVYFFYFLAVHRSEKRPGFADPDP